MQDGVSPSCCHLVATRRRSSLTSGVKAERRVVFGRLADSQRYFLETRLHLAAGERFYFTTPILLKRTEVCYSFIL